MTVNNKLDRSFGPVGTSAGIFILAFGFIMTFYSFFGLILVLLGAFVGLTSTSTRIDYDKKRLKFSNNLFGIIPIGQWIFLNPDMKIGIKKSNNRWRAYSRSNRSLDISNVDYRLILYDTNHTMIMPLQKTDSFDSAKQAMARISKKLGIAAI
jgi:hypothetical protein